MDGEGEGKRKEHGYAFDNTNPTRRSPEEDRSDQRATLYAHHNAHPIIIISPVRSEEEKALTTLAAGDLEHQDR